MRQEFELATAELKQEARRAARSPLSWAAQASPATWGDKPAESARRLERPVLLSQRQFAGRHQFGTDG